MSLTRAELARAAGADRRGARPARGVRARHAEHDRRATACCSTTTRSPSRGCAPAFMRHGIEPRHLRMYRAFAEREASLFEQVLLPYRRQRNPEAQARTTETLGELAGLGRRLRTALLRQTVRRTFSTELTAPMTATRPARRGGDRRSTSQRLGREIAADHPDGVVARRRAEGRADLPRRSRRARSPTSPSTVDFMSISRFAPDSGRVQDPARPRLRHQRARRRARRGHRRHRAHARVPHRSALGRAVRAASSTCTLLDRPAAPHRPAGACDYRGFELGDEYVLGYGLHVRDLYRNVPYVVTADRDALVDRPDAYVADLYRRRGRIGAGTRAVG